MFKDINNKYKNFHKILYLYKLFFSENNININTIHKKERKTIKINFIC